MFIKSSSIEYKEVIWVIISPLSQKDNEFEYRKSALIWNDMIKNLVIKEKRMDLISLRKDS